MMTVHGKIDLLEWNFDGDFKTDEIATAISGAAEAIVNKLLNPQRILKSIGDTMTKELRSGSTINFDPFDQSSLKFPLNVNLPLGNGDADPVLVFDLLAAAEDDIATRSLVADIEKDPDGAEDARKYYVARFRDLADRLERNGRSRNKKPADSASPSQ